MIKSLILTLAFVLLLIPATVQAETKKILDVQVIRTPKGIEAWLVEDKSIPVISMNFHFDGGLVHDPEDKPGVGRLVSIMLDEGAGELKSQEFQTQLTNDAITLGFTAGRDAFFGRLRTLSTNRDKAFGLLKLAVTAPRFDQDALDRMRKANISQIQEDLGDPSWLSARSFNGMIFEGHAYANPGLGHLASMQTIVRKDLVDFVRDQFRRDALKVAIAGDITRAEAERLIDDTFGSLTEKGETPEDIRAELKYSGKTILLPLDAPQTYVAIGAPGIPRTDPLWHAAGIVNYIMGGGGFDARLMKEVREKRGLTYGIYSSLSTMDHAEILQVNFSASNEKVQEALDIIRQQWEKMGAEGPTEREIADAKAYLTGSLLLELSSTADIADVLSGMQRDGLDPDYINRRNKELNAVTLKEARAAAAKLFNKDNLTTILVGKPENINVDILLDAPPGMKDVEKR